jgi:arginyl-tRNA synthetase
MKHSEWPFDKAIVTTASEQNAYWQVVKKAIELIFPELEGKIMHFGFGMIDLKGGKMSSRTGNIVSAIELVEIVKDKVLKELLKNDDEKAAEVIAVGAVKYAFLKSEAKKNMLFDMEQSVSVQGNSGPYLQYTYARLRSVLAKADYKAKALPINDGDTLTAEDKTILHLLPTFQDVVMQAGETYAPHLICTYVYELAQACNLLYDKQSILKASPEEKEMRLALIEAASLTIKTSLDLLGIKVLERI